MNIKSVVLELWEAGLTVTQISCRLKISAGTVCQLITDMQKQFGQKSGNFEYGGTD